MVPRATFIFYYFIIYYYYYYIIFYFIFYFLYILKRDSTLVFAIKACHTYRELQTALSLCEPTCQYLMQKNVVTRRRRRRRRSQGRNGVGEGKERMVGLVGLN
jgi:hypothetical protein